MKEPIGVWRQDPVRFARWNLTVNGDVVATVTAIAPNWCTATAVVDKVTFGRPRANDAARAVCEYLKIDPDRTTVRDV